LVKQAEGIQDKVRWLIGKNHSKFRIRFKKNYKNFRLRLKQGIRIREMEAEFGDVVFDDQLHDFLNINPEMRWKEPTRDSSNVFSILKVKLAGNSLWI
jgi:hypothetical protein